MNITPASTRASISILLARNAAFILAPLILAGVSSAQSVESIIDAVRRQELIYDNLEVELQSTYTDFLAAPAENPEPGDLVSTTNEELLITHVSQDGMFHTEADGASFSGDHSISGHRVRLFDGQTSRLYSQKAIANTADGRREDKHYVRPHMMLFRHLNYHVPLSTLLQGADAIRAHPTGRSDPRVSIDTSYRGEVMQQGLKCHRVWITISHASRKGWSDRWELWLAEDRNYLPVRLIGYSAQVSETQAACEGVVYAMEELAPGVWFPFDAAVTAYDAAAIASAAQQDLNWRAEYKVERASLEPNHDLSYFQDLEIPDGTPEYTIEGKQIVDSGTHGAPGAGESQEPWTLWFTVAVVAVLSGALVSRSVLRRLATGEAG